MTRALNVSDSEKGLIAKFFDIFERLYIVDKKVEIDTYPMMDENSLKERGKFHLNNWNPKHYDDTVEGCTCTIGVYTNHRKK